jgi:hypothetical protein
MDVFFLHMRVVTLMSTSLDLGYICPDEMWGYLTFYHYNE